MPKNKATIQKNMSKRGHYRMTQSDFTSIRELLDAGLNPGRVARILGWSEGLIYTIYRFKSFDEYEQYKKDYAARKRAEAEAEASKAVAPTAVEVPAPEAEEVAAPEEEVITLDPTELNANLKRMAVALERLAKAWESQPTKKTGLFG